MAKKIAIEVAIEGSSHHHPDANSPRTADDVVEQALECAALGAAAVRVHARGDSGGTVNELEAYANIIEQIRSRSDLIVYPSFPALGFQEERYKTVQLLAQRGLLEWIPIDPGSVNFTALRRIERGKGGFPYGNTDQVITYGLALATKHELNPSMGIYEPGFVRAGAAWTATFSDAPKPLFRFMFSSELTFGFPPEPYALEAYLSLLADACPGASWMVAGAETDILPLMPLIAERGGHVRVGLEDANPESQRTNVEWVEAALAAITQAGGEPATPNDLRRELGPALN